ncbi:hypothetical protein PAXINDRAFT_103884 [Paxillus involutus ATCC 200175]|uniref:Unplaced genomic scaffold PAXINscaffold_1869, whole genome shotgun sequence n=1 Tax=Paxillus involutus ATCC 200175 TaxID=664439 RepID=A0A0C9TD89_PAXIN|nr:hypothetical protein PAXINDRAFT_103884 [Paxillus involutus ATCC 200175]
MLSVVIGAPHIQARLTSREHWDLDPKVEEKIDAPNSRLPVESFEARSDAKEGKQRFLQRHPPSYSLAVTAPAPQAASLSGERQNTDSSTRKCASLSGPESRKSRIARFVRAIRGGLSP